MDFSRIPHLSEEEICQKKEELGILSEKLLLLSSGELIPRKNHETNLRRWLS